MIEICRIGKSELTYPGSLGWTLIYFPSDPILSPVDITTTEYFSSFKNDVISLTKAYEYYIKSTVIPKKDKMLRYYLMVYLPTIKTPTLWTIRKLILEDNRYITLDSKDNLEDYLGLLGSEKIIMKSPKFTAYDVLRGLWKNTPLSHTSCSSDIFHLMLCDYCGGNDFKTGLNSYMCSK